MSSWSFELIYTVLVTRNGIDFVATHRSRMNHKHISNNTEREQVTSKFYFENSSLLRLYQSHLESAPVFEQKNSEQSVWDVSEN